ncbi:MAG: PLDc N-terminal domain-containing protein [Rhodospirillaceae bacterium]|nr:PLDc N-terminal domain-containing protein [Rhodospirillaceae bacterium]
MTALLVLHFAIAAGVCVHILLTKPETSAPPWIALVLVSPFIGSLLYWILGINRVQRRARKLRGRRTRFVPQHAAQFMPFSSDPTPQQRQVFLYESAVHDAPFLGGNRITPLIGAAEAFPDMLKSIAEARESIALSVYIFGRDDVGEKFIAALKEAHGRGVKTYVLVDEIGSGTGSNAADKKLADAGISTARFIPQKIKFLPFVNLRNHRKIIIIDGLVGYIGGMNIARNYNGDATETVRDIHFRVEGPVLAQMSTVFEEDWRFASGRAITLPDAPRNETTLALPQYARAVPDGPDNPFQRTLWIMLGALALAQKSVHILTPYFLPNDALTHALAICALRGVDVRVVVPKATDIRLMDWAMTAKYPDLLEHGVKIYWGGAPFDHSKLMVVDDVWILVGSSNWDQRSLRLNFEANLEVYDADLAAQMDSHFQAMQRKAQLISVAELKALPVLVRLRNNIARLFTPYL